MTSCDLPHSAGFGQFNIAGFRQLFQDLDANMRQHNMQIGNVLMCLPPWEHGSSKSGSIAWGANLDQFWWTKTHAHQVGGLNLSIRFFGRVLGIHTIHMEVHWTKRLHHSQQMPSERALRRPTMDTKWIKTKAIWVWNLQSDQPWVSSLCAHNYLQKHLNWTLDVWYSPPRVSSPWYPI